MRDVIAYVHTHWDREWYREFQEFRLRLIEVFDEILEQLETGNLSCFYFDGQTSAMEDYLELRPEKAMLIKYLIKEKKLRVGPFYCASDSLLISGECLYKNLKIGIEKSKEFGENDFIAYMADSFGHSKDIPVLLKPFRITKACMWRGLGDLSADLNWSGLRVTNLLQGYFQNYLHGDIPIAQKAENLKKYLDKISKKSDNTIILPIGADHLAVVKNIAQIIKELNIIYNDYRLFLGSPFDYFYRTYKTQETEGEFLDNKKTFLLKGVYSCRQYIKRENAKCQWLLNRIAEPLNSILYKFCGAKNKQNELNYASKELIKNQAHDSIYGCTIDETADEIMQRYRTVTSIANGVIKRTVRDIEDDNAPLCVINLSNYRYSGRVFIETEKELPIEYNALKISSRKGFTDKKLYDINDIPVTEDFCNINTYLIDVHNLEPFSINKITAENLCQYNYLKSGKSFIENSYIKVEIKNNKICVTDKILKEVYKDFIVINDRADIGDSYNFGALTGDKPIKAEVKSYKIEHLSSKRAVLNIVFEIEIPVMSEKSGRSKNVDKCKIQAEFILYNQSRMVETSLKWVNKSKNHILQLGFNLKEKIKSTTSEDLFTTVKRKINSDYNIYKEIPAKKGIELKTNTFPMQRFVNAQNVTVFTKGISEYEIQKNMLFITLLRATGIISNPENPSRGTPAGPPLETPKMQCLGENIAEFAFAFTSNEDKMYELSDEYYYPCVCAFSNIKDRIFFIPKGRVNSVAMQNSCLIARIYDGELKNIVIKH